MYGLCNNIKPLGVHIEKGAKESDTVVPIFSNNEISLSEYNHPSENERKKKKGKID